MDNENDDKQSGQDNLDPTSDKNQPPFLADQQPASSNLPPTKKHHKKVVTIVLVAAVSLAVIIGGGILVIKSSVSNVSKKPLSIFPQDKNYPEKISAAEKKAVSQEVVSTLKRKYGNTASFQVLNMKKGEYRIGDVSGRQKYFSINMHIKSPAIEADFRIDYVRRTEDLYSKIQEKYKNNITDELKAFNSSVSAVSYSLSDYNGKVGESRNDFGSIDTEIGHIPTQKDVELLIQSIDITYENRDGVNKYKNGIDEFISAKKPEVKKMYAYIAQTYPRIPKGIGATSVEIDFSNGVIIRILPLSKDIVVIAQGNSTENVDYKWSELVD